MTRRQATDCNKRQRIYTAGAVTALLGSTACAAPPSESAGAYPWHTDVVATTFWVGEIHDPRAPDGSQVRSAYDVNWMENYGGCDGIVRGGECRTEPRTAVNKYMPTEMTPLQNPFYLDLPFDDVNDPIAFKQRGQVVPWADEPPYSRHIDDPEFSLMKNRWVRLRKDGKVCYGQIEDAGPALYHDANYVFGKDDERPASTEYNGSGMDVSPALNGCLGFADLNGANDRVDWQFVDERDVPSGPWRQLVTTNQVEKDRKHPKQEQHND
jgi:hypothetical protein